jgi:hypothetical protein
VTPVADLQFYLDEFRGRRSKICNFTSMSSEVGAASGAANNIRAPK